MPKQSASLEPKLSPYEDLLAVEVTQQLDARGLACPMPLLKAKQALHALQEGDKLRVLATDKGAVRDFHSFAHLSGHKISWFAQNSGEYYFIIIKNSGHQ